MSKQKKGQSSSGRTFKLIHQSLTISDVNFRKQTIIVSWTIVGHIYIYIYGGPGLGGVLSVWRCGRDTGGGVNKGVTSTSSLQGYTELTVLPLTNTGKLWRLPLNCCCRQCRILRVTVNSSHNANYSYSDPALCICPPDTKK